MASPSDGKSRRTAGFSRPFAQALREGQAAEKKWVEKQRKRGLCVGHGKRLVYTNHNRRKDHVDTPDAVLMFSAELKQRDITFTCPSDFPYDDVIVDDLRGMERESLNHLAYIYVSKATGAWVWLCSLDMDETWRRGEVFDRKRNHKVPVLFAPKSCLRPAEELEALIYPHTMLDVVDGDAGLFRSGGGNIERREGSHGNAIGGDNPKAAPRKRRASEKTD